MCCRYGDQTPNGKLDRTTTVMNRMTKGEGECEAQTLCFVNKVDENEISANVLLEKDSE